MRSLYVTHPQVIIDPSIPTPQWGLSALGIARARAFADRGVVPDSAMIFSSAETKATDLASIIAEKLAIRVVADPAMGENDRSSTGFLPPDRFEAMADRFFGEPEVRAEGWERAIDAQARIVAAVRAALETLPEHSPAVFCGHGAVGTLLKCHVGGRAIARSEDQSRHADRGGGNCFSFDLDALVLGCEWTAMEDFAPGWFD